MKLFDKKFVYFMWDDELEGKECFVASEIDDLVRAVNENREGHKYNVHKSNDPSWPFQAELDCEPSAFAYYDPNYEVKKAFNEGKTIQYQLVGEVDWRDVEDEDALERYIEEGRQFRVKPKEKKWIAYLNRTIKLDSRGCYLTACREDRWESVQKDYGAKTKLFIGTENEVIEWYKSRQKFAEVIKAWEDNKAIQFKTSLDNIWLPASNPEWNVDVEYRVKPMEVDYPCVCDEFSETEKSDEGEEKKKEWWEIADLQIGQIEYWRKDSKIPKGWYLCDGRKLPKEFIGNKAVEEVVNTYGTPGSMRLPDMRPANCAIYLGDPNYSPLREDGIDSKACVGCEHSEDGKKECRSYESSAEMIADFVNRFKVKCPPYAAPLIWVKSKDTGYRYLIITFYESTVMLNANSSTGCSLWQLFDFYTYLDGSTCGKEC